MDILIKNKNGLNSKKWGSIFWYFLHIISLNYPIEPSEKEKLYFFYVIKSLQYILPCKKCRIHIKKNLKEMKYNNKKYYKNRKNFILLIFKIHNKVNSQLGKEKKKIKIIHKYDKKYRVNN